MHKKPDATQRVVSADAARAVELGPVHPVMYDRGLHGLRRLAAE